MKKISEPIIFFGSGPVAAKTLEFLESHFAIHGVITKPVPPHHHEKAPVIEVAERNSLDIYYVRDKNDLIELFRSQKISNNIRLGILVDFGVIIPSLVLHHFKLGIINSHFSLLPEWRGADPITFAILSGQLVTGVSLMLIVEGMDEGPVLAQKPYNLSPDTTTPQLTEDLIKLSNSMLASTLPPYISGKIHPVEQNKNNPVSYSRRLTKDDGRVDWHKDATQLEREIRAFAGWPRSHATINDTQVIITKAHTIDLPGEAGKVDSIDGKLVIHCGKQSLIIDWLKPVSKNEMSGSDFLRGHPI